MKFIISAIVIIVATTGLVLAQSTKQNDALEKEIRKLEQSQIDALLRNDLAAMERNWSKDYTVNNPFSQAVKASEGPIWAGTLTYSSFIREVEKVLFHGKTVIV